ncbi:M20/M25/M40 family metallo-hydrolase [Kordiimonas pumila]|uniref:M20/M25/M40 family metallo-hydrolase n=1 Tax=Kordiimonas pumila TaxID=2161677 RepID=A0ABV7D446_9PROT|nr:M20/M25/M40 family metallo-hydrolase [Kordiimonas pumila]
MKKITGIISSILLAGHVCMPAYALEAEQPFQAKAEEMLRTTIGMRTSQGFGQVPKMAAYLAGEFEAAGFDKADIHILPIGETAALVVRYKGDGSAGKKPILLSAHMDVVAADPADWERDPFTMVKENGYYFGRGTSDNKFGVSVLTATLMRLKSEGFVPGRDIVLALSGDEETEMYTTSKLATEYRNLTDAEYALVADGGGGQLDEDGNAIAFSVDSAEKTYATFEMKAVNPGGHSSVPRKDNAIKDLATALTNIFNYEFPVQKSELTLEFFGKSAPLIGGELGEAMKRFAENPDDAEAVAIIRSYPSYVGSTGTTCVPTMLKGGHAENALPQSAVATVNCRIFPGVGVQKTLEQLKAVAGNDALEWTVLDNPIESDASPIRADVFTAIANGVHASYPGLPIIPHMASGASDGVHFRANGIPSYTFSGIFMKSSDEYAHGLNERVPTATLPVALKMWHSILTELAK